MKLLKNILIVAPLFACSACQQNVSFYSAQMSNLCVTKETVLTKSARMQFSFSGGTAVRQLEFAVVDPSTGKPYDFGVDLQNVQALSVDVKAPNAIGETIRLAIHASAPGAPDAVLGQCFFTLAKDGSLGVQDNGTISGLVGNVYPVPAWIPALPDFSQMTPVARIVMSTIDVPERPFNQGFTGVPDLFEWFGIQFRGRITIPHEGMVKFKVTSDDGSRLYIDNQLVVDLDGIHPPASAEAQGVLSAGVHEIRLDYYQGPRDYIALQLFWDLGDGKGYVIIPPSALDRPAK